MSDITIQLRTWFKAVDAIPAIDLMDEAANEIDRLRLTDEEREAVEQAIDAASGMAQAEPWAVATLRKLLERMK